MLCPRLSTAVPCTLPCKCNQSANNKNGKRKHKSCLFHQPASQSVSQPCEQHFTLGRLRPSPLCPASDKRSPTLPTCTTTPRLALPLHGDGSIRKGSLHHKRSRSWHAKCRRYRTCRKQQRLLLPLVYCPQEGWGKTTGDKSQTTEQIYLDSYIQNGFCFHCRQSYPTRRLGNIPRLKRRLLPYSHPQKVPAVPKIHLERDCLPIPVNPFRAFHGPLHIHPSHKTRNAVVPGTRDESHLLLRRHTHPCRVTADCKRKHSLTQHKAPEPRLQDKFEQIRTDPVSRVHLPGPLLGHKVHARHAPTRQNSGDTRIRSRSIKPGTPYLTVDPAVSGKGQLRLHRSTSRQTTVPCPSTDRAEGRVSTLQQSITSSRSTQCPSMVGSTETHFVPSILPGTDNDADNRCVISGLGSMPLINVNQRSVAYPLAIPEGPPHKRTRNASSSYSSLSLGPNDVRTNGSATSRQLLNSPLHKKRGGNKIGHLMQTRCTDLRHMPQPPHTSDPQPSPGNSQLPIRCPVTGETPGRVASQFSSSSKSFSPPRTPRSGPVRITTDSPSPEILFPGQGGQKLPGDRCPGTPMEIQINVCIPPSGSPAPHDTKVQTTGRKPNPDSPLLEGGPMVHRGLLSPDPTAIQAPVPQGPGDQHHDAMQPAIVEPAPPNGMAAFKTIITAAGISEEVAEFVAASWRDSTSTQYQSAWRSWVTWCETSGLDTTSISVGKLLDYLLFLYAVRNLSWSTVGVHRSAISSFLQPLSTPTLGEHPLVSRFMRSLFLKNPPATNPRWSWDMATVLSYLKNMGLPSTLPLRQLTWKLAFLVAVFSARRMADLHLLRISDAHLQLTRHSAVLQPAFGAKQDRPGHQSPVLILRAYSDKRLCPVATLSEYLSRTRHPNRDDNLFLSTIPPYKAAAKATIKRWILAVLREAGLEGTAGSTRAAAASYSLARNVSMQTIMESADWSRSSTMFRHYVRLLPAEVLAHIARRSADNVQAAVLQAI